MTFQKVFVLGAGAVGSSIGALLSAKNNVTLIGRKAHVGMIKSRGLLVITETKRELKIDASTSISEIPPSSLVVLTTKAQDLVAAVESVRGFLKRDTVFLVLQNGLGIKDLVQEVVGTEIEVVRGLTQLAAEFLEPGTVRFWKGQTVVEKTQGGRKIASLFNESGLTTVLSEDIKTEEWSKLAANCVINSLTAILRVRNNEIADASLQEIRHKIVKECIEVAEAEGIALKSGLEKDIDSKIISYTNYSSMCQDIMKGRKTEIDFLNGAIVKIGKKHAIQTPVNETMVGLIRFLEETK